MYLSQQSSLRGRETTEAILHEVSFQAKREIPFEIATFFRARMYKSAIAFLQSKMYKHFKFSKYANAFPIFGAVDVDNF